MYQNLSNSILTEKFEIKKLPSKFLKHCIIDAREEDKLIKTIPTFNHINNQVSLKIRQQYEVFPYPAWLYTNTYLQRTNMKDYLKSLEIKLYNNDLFSKKQVKILIGGCGTGKEPAEIGELIENTEITAVDISKKSLGYAARQCKEMKINNVNFLHGDILNLQELNKKFDVVLSNGVIHHMEDPIKGCKSLLACLKNKGLLKLSLYSYQARKDLVFYQKIAKTRNIHTHESVRNFRKEIINNKLEREALIELKDFYNANEFKDLICNEQEHTFTIINIKELIDICGIKFCGFQNISNLHEKFIKYYGSSENLHNLDYWEEFEKENPKIFIGMYQFWCQKT